MRYFRESDPPIGVKSRPYYNDNRLQRFLPFLWVSAIAKAMSIHLNFAFNSFFARIVAFITTDFISHTRVERFCL